MRIFNAMDLHIRTGWQLENIDKMVEQLSEDSLCIIDKNEATEIKRAEDDEWIQLLLFLKRKKLLL